MKNFDVYKVYDLTPVRGAGACIYDEAGTEYLDVYGGHAVISVGHSHPHYVAGLRAQLDQLAYYSNSVKMPQQQQLAEQLGKLSGCENYQLFLCNSGAEAIENALKLASFRTGHRRVIAFEGAFHGRTSAAVRATDNPRLQAPINQTFPVDWLPLDDLDAVAKALAAGDVAAVIIEGIQGIGGIHVPNADFLRGLRTLCDRTDTPLILDEIQSGYGRSGRFFAFQHAGIEPDLITVAKGMGNGFPVGGVLIRQDYPASPGLLGSTFGGNPLACAACLAVLDIMEAEDLIAHAAEAGAALMPRLASLSGVRAVRGQGLMIGLEFDFPVAELRKRLLFEQRVFVGSSSDPKVLRLLPPLNIRPDQLNQLVSALHAALTPQPQPQTV